jgi:para-aminobenzoate synthetase/4-amino-4-deoxychorismate lyase
MNGMPQVILQSHVAGEGHSFRFSGLIEEVSTQNLGEVIPALQKVESWVARGYHAAGFLSYEAATAFDSALITRPPGDFPLLWFGIFAKRRTVAVAYPDRQNTTNGSGFVISDWKSSVDRTHYDTAIDRIKGYIAAGDTYQVNFTLRQRFSFSGSMQSCYRELCRPSASYCAFLDLGKHSILSTSAGAFLPVEGRPAHHRPMKGTAKRGRSVDEDAEIVAAFKENAKERAENLMIVDLFAMTWAGSREPARCRLLRFSMWKS